MQLLAERILASTAAAIFVLLCSAGLATGAEGCLSCHEGIERFSDGDMQDTIEAMGADLGDPGGCVVCHGGDPKATSAEAAHQGAPAELTEDGGPDMFYPDPGSVWIADKACGQCHDGYAERVKSNPRKVRMLMNRIRGPKRSSVRTIAAIAFVSASVSRSRGCVAVGGAMTSVMVRPSNGR